VFDQFGVLPIDIALGVVATWLILGIAGLMLRHTRHLTTLALPFSAFASLILALAGLAGLSEPSLATLPLGMPGLPFHLRMDALSSFFLFLLGAASLGITLFSAGYFAHMEAARLRLLHLEYQVFLAAMALVFLADDAYLFMVCWESMALASYLLVATEHEKPEVRRAGFLYLLLAHIGAIGILMSFGVMDGGHGDYTFDAMRQNTLTSGWASVAFVLALFGFGAKAGLLPLHAWLPEAHPAAPSPVSAMMSGIMLKTAIYGIVRVSFDLLGTDVWWWGVLALTVGLVTALFGVIFAAVQVDMKRLLAYSSIKNIGMILAALGLALIFHHFGKDQLAALSLIAALYHTLNHAFIKGLLFLGAGAVLHATGERYMGRLGGLIRRMPQVAFYTLIAVLAMAGLPPLNLFVSEWLMLQAFLFSPGLPQSYINMLVPIAAAALALAAALSGYVMVKFFGLVFLGQPRAIALDTVHEAGRPERYGMAWLALGCVLLGLFPVAVVHQLDHVASLLVHQTMSSRLSQSGWLLLTPVQAERASYGPFILAAIMLSGVFVIVQVVKRFYNGRLRRGPAWDCGFPAQTAAMQDSAEGFGQPIRQIFEGFIVVVKQLPSPFDRHPRYHSETRDPLWDWLYLPVKRLNEGIAARIGKLQHGRIHAYLLYSFLTLLALLVFVE
jgi:formate hydrogenlyase subunit 3/multisubunit Na+/H+ antiporter MnhD subunit